MRTLLVAPDKFRGTATARDVCTAVSRVVGSYGWECDLAPMADGGEGTLEIVAGNRRVTSVTGPLGNQVEAEWVLQGGTAIIEMARALGLVLAGGVESNDPLAATTTGTGELIAAAIAAGADRVVVGLGGSATTDGGLGCVKALWPHARLREIELVAATDVDTLFVDSARVFGPQKGASPSQVGLLEGRLQRVAEEYQKQFGVDVRDIPGSGSAGGLGGGLLAVGGSLVRGFDYFADLVELDDRVEQADLVVTGEGFLDDLSFDGKVVGGVHAMARRVGVPVLVVVGDVDETVDVTDLTGTTIVSLVKRFGHARSMRDTLSCIEEVVAEYLEERRA